MKSKQILFFTTKEDILPIIQNIEKNFHIKYVEMGLFNENQSKEIASITELDSFASPSIADWNRDQRFMIVPYDSNIIVRPVPQNKGGIKYAVDPLENQISVSFQAGGMVREGVLLAGKLGTAFINEFSLKIFKEFSSLLKKKCTKIGDFYVGNDAKIKLQDGWRLSTNENFSKEYDLRLT